MNPKINGDANNLVAAYETDGVIRLPRLFDPAGVNELRERIARYSREVRPTLAPSEYVMEADGVSVRNLWRMEHRDPFFAELASHPSLMSFIRHLVHGEPVLMGVETFNKPAKVGSGVPHHQDNAYFCQSPPDMLTVWIAMDAATIDNGPVYYIKGSQRGGVLPHAPSGVAGNSMGLIEKPGTPLDEQFCGTLDAGDALIHHCQTIHHSAANRSDRPRLGLLFVYRGAHTQNDPALKAAYERARAPVAVT